MPERIPPKPELFKVDQFISDELLHHAKYPIEVMDHHKERMMLELLRGTIAKGYQWVGWPITQELKPEFPHPWDDHGKWYETSVWAVPVG